MAHGGSGVPGLAHARAGPRAQDPQQQPATGWAAKIFRDASGVTPAGHDFGTVPKGAAPAPLCHDEHLRGAAANPHARFVRLRHRHADAADPPAARDRHARHRHEHPGFNGAKQVTVYVTVVSPAASQQQQFSSTMSFSITGFCRGDVTLEPGQAQFGVVPRGQPVTRHRRSQVRRPAELADVETRKCRPRRDGPVRGALQEMERRPGHVTYRVSLALKSDAVAGTFKGDLQLQSNDPNNRLVPIPYDITVQAPLTVSPEMTSFGTVKVGEVKTGRIILRGNKPFRVVAAEGKDDGVTMEGPTTPAAVQVLTIKYQPTAAGDLPKALTIKTDLDGGATVLLASARRPCRKAVRDLPYDDSRRATAMNRLASESSCTCGNTPATPWIGTPGAPRPSRSARELDRPIFLCIGYSACHWCHVMEHESFEDPEIARRSSTSISSASRSIARSGPTSTQIYMTAVQVLDRARAAGRCRSSSRRDLEPFYGGTYFPPRRPLRPARLPARAAGAGRGLARPPRRGRPNGRRRSPSICAARGQLAGGRRATSTTDAAATARRRQLGAFDPSHGGFGPAPKFPHPMDLRLLLAALAALRRRRRS